VQDLEGVVADGDLVALVEPAVGQHVPRAARQAVGAPLLGQALEEKAITLVRALDRHRGAARPRLERLLEVGGAAGVVDMAVGEQDLLGPDAELLDGGEDLPNIAPRVDDGRADGLLVPEDRAVLLERGDGDDSRLQAGHRWSPSVVAPVGWPNLARPGTEVQGRTTRSPVQ
jgi:hypothetical protein